MASSNGYGSRSEGGQESKTFIAIAGNIGSGKSSLTTWLADRLGYEACFEVVDDNPYLDDFYRDMKTWSFQTQVYFLSRRFENHRRISSGTRSVVQDRSIYEDYAIFARSLFEQGMMEERDFRNYEDLYKVMARFFEPPDLLIYLKCSVPTLMRRIRKRGREFEREIPRDYIEHLNTLYDDFVENFADAPKLVLPGDDLDFVGSYHDFSFILDMIDNMRIDPLRLQASLF
ncbi:MAG: deoxynucleoside kinase [Cyanobacteria bacterium REEB65]|nr:deoxynucleoside kinase [Cyanobacteria bacterium REEB65]